MTEHDHILLFDGVCKLCNRLVIFIIKRDKQARIRFAALQSDTGEFYLAKNGLSPRDIDSIVYIEGERLYLKSSAVLHILKTIGGYWGMFYVFIFIPKFISNSFYDLVAAGRYRIFGKSDTCMIPPPEFADRFLL